MPETSKRVNLTLTFATDAERDSVMRWVLDSLPYDLSAVLESTSVHDFDLDEPDGDEPAAHLVVTTVRGIDGICGVYIDGTEQATEHAQSVGAVLLELPVVADYRGETDAT